MSPAVKVIPPSSVVPVPVATVALVTDELIEEARVVSRLTVEYFLTVIVDP